MKKLGLSLAIAGQCALAMQGASADVARYPALTAADNLHTATPIKHLVIIYGENVSFDHYFGTYPQAANPEGVPQFHAKADTPKIDGLTPELLQHNGNLSNTDNGEDASAPFRLLRAQAASADQNHAYTAEQRAYNGGKMDLFPKYTGKGSAGSAGSFGSKGQVMGYYDGNTVTALWNYAQQYAMNDNAYTDTYGPSTPGALEVIAGQNDGFVPLTGKGIGGKPPVGKETPKSWYIRDGQGGYALINDIDPAFDVCTANAKGAGYMLGKNIGDLLNAKNISWGGFMAGFDLTASNTNGTTGCARASHSDVVHKDVVDYIPHHNWFQYYQSTANYTHARPSSLKAIGFTTEADGITPDSANHQYDLNDFVSAVKAGNYPAVSYVKLAAYQDGHAGYSDPLDEQVGDVKLINFLMQQPDWKNTAVIVTYDDSDGWYDHKFTQPTSASADPYADQLDGAGKCGNPDKRPNGILGAPVNGRCGPGTRIPFLVISPYAKSNAVTHNLITQASIVKFIEDNWLEGQRIGGGSFDATTGSINALFDFDKKPNLAPFYISPSLGTVLKTAPQGSDNPSYL